MVSVYGAHCATANPAAQGPSVDDAEAGCGEFPFSTSVDSVDGVAFETCVVAQHRPNSPTDQCERLYVDTSPGIREESLPNTRDPRIATKNPSLQAHPGSSHHTRPRDHVPPCELRSSYPLGSLPGRHRGDETPRATNIPTHRIPLNIL